MCVSSPSQWHTSVSQSWEECLFKVQSAIQPCTAPGPQHLALKRAQHLGRQEEKEFITIAYCHHYCYYYFWGAEGQTSTLCF